MDETWRDPVVECIADYTVGTSVDRAGVESSQARLVLGDTLAVGLGAFSHSAAQIARNYLALFPADPNGVVVWGTNLKATPDKATLVNGVLLRCYDYNDVFFGRCTPGHPSDMISALIAAADWKNLDGEALLSALVVGYEVAAALYDVLPAETAGWDHASVTCVAATCAIGRLLSLSPDQLREAIGIASIQHLQSDEIESCVLNRRGDLTMWKRFHGSDAMRHALDSCMLASVGAEGAVRPISGRLGLLAKFGVGGEAQAELLDRLKPGITSGAIMQTNLKRWPVGSRAQSAIASAIAARKKVAADTEITSVSVETTPDVYNHLVAIRHDPWRPQTREQADHSLPYIVGTAVLDGFVDVKSFDLHKVLDPARASFIAEKIKIEVSKDMDETVAASRVTIRTAGGAVFEGPACAAPGHRLNPFTEMDVQAKLRDSATALLGTHAVDNLIEELAQVSAGRPVRRLTALLAASYT